MDIQTLIVALVILSALAYAGKQVFRKAKSFSPAKTSGCAADCGCGSKAKA